MANNEVVKYHNDLNTVVMRTWNAEEMNFFFAILAKYKESGNKTVSFNTDEIKDLVSSSRRYRWNETMEMTAKKLGQLTFFEKANRKFRVMTLFDIFEVDLDEKTVTVKVSSNFEYILNRLENQFTRYELAEFVSIRSTYAKTMYRLLKQWRTLGKKEFKIEELKLLLDMPKSYRPTEIDRLAIKPILSQLKPYFEGLKVKKVKSNKRGNPVLGYAFSWKPEETGVFDPQKFEKQKQAKAQKKAKSQQEQGKSNVPEWHNPNYVNNTTEEQKAEMEEKVKELLAKMDKQENRENENKI